MALRMPHRPLAAATLQCITSAMLKPYPSVGDVAQYLVSWRYQLYWFCAICTLVACCTLVHDGIWAYDNRRCLVPLQRLPEAACRAHSVATGSAAVGRRTLE